MPGIYIHVPFCSRQCNYCDFFFTTNTSWVNSYVRAVKKEIASKKNVLEPFVTSIYFGGGTPSLLDVSQLESILSTCYQHYAIDDHAEVSIEVNPEHAVQSYLLDLNSVGINRVSLGVQSFSNRKLASLSRVHSREDAERAVACSLNVFQNVSIDLIFGESYETMYEWRKDLEMAVSLDPQHISTYCLTIEKGTILERKIRSNQIDAPKDDSQAEFYLVAMDILENHGYQHYEVSNFAKRSKESIHHLSYWQRDNYLGFGPSAHSFIENTRFSNARNLSRYLDSPCSAIDYEEVLDERKIQSEALLLGIRQARGIKAEELLSFFSKDGSDFVTTFINQGLLEKHDGYIKVTKQGFLYVDSIVIEILNRI